jgi:hypothetical protein
VGRRPPCSIAIRPDNRELAAAVASLLSQYGYEIALIEPATER